MGMSVGENKGGAMAEMNVVPLIDILLVLLIIFMVITPLTPTGMDTLVPQPNPNQQQGLDAMVPQPAIDGPNDPVDSIIVLQVLSDGGLRINQEPVAWDHLADRMAAIYKERARKVAFIRGEAPVEFALVARVIDVHGSGISVGLLTPGLEQQR